MNIFNKVLAKEHATDTQLGMPLYGVACLRRAETMARMTGGKGFRTQPKELRTDAQGKTRGQRKRAACATAMAKVSEVRASQFMHSHARRMAA